MEVKIEYKLPEDMWFVQIGDETPLEFSNRFLALMYLNNKTLLMVAEEE